MKTIAFHLQKGGVGKTSLSVSIAVELARRGRTVLVDIDPQGNSSSWLLTEAPAHELAEALLGTVPPEDVIVPTSINQLDILPTFGIDGQLKLYGENQLANEPFVFCDLVERLAALGYEFAVFDMSPGMGRLERAALIAADEVLTPMTPEAFSLDGIDIFVNELAKVKKAMRRGPVHNRIIINALDSRIGQHTDIAAKAGDLLTNFKLYTVPVDPIFRKAQGMNKPIQAAGKERPKPETLTALRGIAGDL